VARYDDVVTALMRLPAKLWFIYLRAVRHDLLVRQLRLPGRRWWLAPFGQASRAFAVVRRCWGAAFAEEAFRHYAAGTRKHYGPDGLAYGHLASLPEAARLARFGDYQGRIRHYLGDHRVLDFSDGDSFLDCGCGPGQNAILLRRAFQTSPIKAFDYSADAIALLRLVSKDDPLTTAERGDVLDASYLASYPSGSFDHVLISHVMSFLIRPTINETRQARQHIVDELVRIARKTVVVLDRIEPERTQMSIDIEQRDRAIVHDDLTQYFKRHETQGERQVYLMLSPEDGAIVYRKATPAGAVLEG
jgi:ubiquinone/menaquinone biosynthesis C-methylase UbiE